MKAFTKFGKLCLSLLFTGLTLHAAAQVQQLPYSTNFSDTAGWVLINGDCTNAWHIGTPSGSTGKALFVSQNGQDATFNYEMPARVFAKKLLKMGNSERITVEFDLQVGGGYYGNDYLKVYIMDTNQYLYASSTSNYSEPSPFNFSDYLYCGQFKGEYGISQHNGHVSMQIPNPSKGENAYIVFLWHDIMHYQESYAYQPAPIITNLSVKETPDNEVKLEKPKYINIYVTAKDSIQISWNAGRDETQWEVKLGENGTTTLSTSNIMYMGGLTNRTDYTAYIRAVKGNYHSDWSTLDFYFTYDPDVWTHGPDSISHNYARLTGAISYIIGLKPTSYGLTYKRMTDDKWVYLKGNVSDEWEGQLEINAEATNLQAFTWYLVGAWAVTPEGDTITSGTEYPHTFLTYDNDSRPAAKLPYTAKFDCNDTGVECDYWGLSQGQYNWYAGKLSGHTGNSLFISPNGNDTAYTEKAVMVNSYAQKKLEAPNGDYLTVKINFKKDGTYFMGVPASGLYAALSFESAGGFKPWFESEKELSSLPNGDNTFYLKKPQNYSGDSTLPLYLILYWNDMEIMDGVEYEFGKFAAIINSITVEETPEDTIATITNCHTPNINYVELSSFTSASIYWDWEDEDCQYQVIYGNGTMSAIIDCQYHSFVELTDLVPNCTAVFKLRTRCKDSTWGEWTQTEIDTKAAPEMYVMPVKEVTETSASIEGYLYHQYLQFNAIKEFGFEYAEPSVASFRNITELEWNKLPYDKIDTIYDESGNGGTSLLYKLHAPIDNLVKGRAYVVRIYATTNNDITHYSDMRSFIAEPVRVNEAGETVSMRVWPNPAEDHAMLQLEGVHGDVQVCLTDMQGKILYKTMMNGESLLRINTAHLASGLYFIKVQGKETNMVSKIAVR